MSPRLTDLNLWQIYKLDIGALRPASNSSYKRTVIENLSFGKTDSDDPFCFVYLELAGKGGYLYAEAYTVCILTDKGSFQLPVDNGYMHRQELSRKYV